MANRAPAGSGPLVSVGLPVYNGGRTVRHAIESLLGQTHRDIELVISDNASTDDTREVCLDYAAADPRVRYSANDTNVFTVGNFNRAFELSTGAYFMWASHDDSWHADYVSECLEALLASDRIILAGSKCAFLDSRFEQTIDVNEGCTTVGLPPAERYKQYLDSLRSQKDLNSILYGVMRRDPLEQVLPMRNVIAFDHYLLARLSFAGEFVTVPKVLMYKRAAGASRSRRAVAAAFGKSGPVAVSLELLMREAFFQEIILRESGLPPGEKARLSAWSIAHSLVDYPKAFWRMVNNYSAER